MAETPEVGFGEACATALQTLAMVVVNRAARSSSGDAADHAGDDAALRDGGDAVSGCACRSWPPGHIDGG